ncbi:MAG: 50S ribosomal protein L21 [Candidatus Omnitrophota bacterium]
MYAIVKIGSDQFKVSEGDIIEVDHLAEDAGKKIAFEDVLMVANGDEVKIGQPVLAGAKVQAEVIGDAQGEKVIAFKYRKRKASAFKKGHREKLTALKITKISN